MQQRPRVNSIALFAVVMCSVSAYAVQPITDEYLALTAGENSIVLNSDLVNSKKFIIEQDLSLVEEPAYQSLLILNLRYHTSLARTIGQQIENFTKNFGLEPVSYQWQGNYTDIWDLSRHSNVTFNHQSGQYELNNVQGKIWLEVETYRKNN